MYDEQLSPGWMANRGHEHFPCAFSDYSSTVMPKTMIEALNWAKFIMDNNGVYKSAIKRVLSYFITEVEVGDEATGDDEKKKYEEFFGQVLHVKKVLHRVGMHFCTFGNAFVSLVVPFRRYLRCPRCQEQGRITEHPLKVVFERKEFGFRWQGYEFRARCQNKECSYTGAWDRIDRRTTDQHDIKVKVWTPREIDIKFDEFSETRQYIWKIPETYKRKVREGHLHYLENANWEVIECIKDGKNLEFSPDVIYHLYDDAIDATESAGWGISPILANFRQAWYVQVLHRYNEGIAMDYILPFRVITPAAGRGQNGDVSDPAIGLNLGGLKSQVLRMLRERRYNPLQWAFLPQPVEYQILGGEAKQLAPYELLDQGVSLLLNNIGVPAEMYKGSLSVQSFAPNMRLFETQWTALVDGFNTFLTKLCDQVAAALGWEPTKARLISPTVIDDVQDQMAKLQLMMGRQISQTTGLKGMGLDFKDEQRRIMEEERFVQETQQKVQEEMDQSAAAQQLGADPAAAMQPQGQPGQPGQPGQQGQPAAGGGQSLGLTSPNQKTTPQDMLQQAQAIAEQLLALPEGQRRSQLSQLKQQDQAMHGLVNQMLDDIRQEHSSSAGQQSIQQTYGGS